MSASSEPSPATKKRKTKSELDENASAATPVKRQKSTTSESDKTPVESIKKSTSSTSEESAHKGKAKSKVDPIPKGYHTVTPYLIVDDAAKALELYKKAFGATEVYRLADPKSGKIMHSEIIIGDSHVMMADEIPGVSAFSPKKHNNAPISICLYVDDAEEWARRAVAAGMKLAKPVTEQFYGDRSGRLEDSFGHVWTVATHFEDVSSEEMMKRMAAMH